MKTIWVAMLAAAFSACAPDVSTRIFIAPSAEHRSEEIARSVDRLNALLGSEVYTIEMITGSERLVNDGVLIREVASLGYGVAGKCVREREGIAVYIVPESIDISIAHELVHAAGLTHVSDKDNMMHPRAYAWKLTQEQIDAIR